MWENFILSCESTVDLPYSYVSGRNMPVLFYSYLIDGQEYPDDMGRDPEALPRFYRFLEEGKMPSTSRTNVFKYTEFLTELLKKGDVLHIAFGSGMTPSVKNALAAERGGAAALAMHGRTRKQMYSGHADWDILKQVADALTIPFMGNGDVKTPQDAKRMLDEVGADAVMIGRAVLGNPWMLKRTVHYLETGELLPEATPEQKITLAKEHLHALIGLKGEYVGVREFRGLAPYYLKGISHSARTKVALMDTTEEGEMDKMMDDLIAQLEAHQ